MLFSGTRICYFCEKCFVQLLSLSPRPQSASPSPGLLSGSWAAHDASRRAIHLGLYHSLSHSQPSIPSSTPPPPFLLQALPPHVRRKMADAHKVVHDQARGLLPHLERLAAGEDKKVCNALVESEGPICCRSPVALKASFWAFVQFRQIEKIPEFSCF